MSQKLTAKTLQYGVLKKTHKEKMSYFSPLHHTQKYKFNNKDLALLA